MKSCPECGGDVQDTHSFCPECRTPISAPAKATARGTDADDSSDGGGTVDGGMDVSRRNLLVYGGAAVGTAAVGGAGGFLLLSGGNDPGDPEETVRSFVTAMDEGDTEQFNSLIHEDADIERLNESNAAMLEGINMSVESSEVLSENATNAEVRVNLSTTFMGETQTSTSRVLLETQNGEWRILGGDTGVSG